MMLATPMHFVFCLSFIYILFVVYLCSLPSRVDFSQTMSRGFVRFLGFTCGFDHLNGLASYFSLHCREGVTF